MIYVCDAIMGSGKTQAAIIYMNEHPCKKFVYITPYLDEANRIKRGCQRLNFVEPSDKIAEYGFTKYQHAMALIDEGRNIATTHQAFKRYTQETLKKIREQEYTLIIDESISVLEPSDCKTNDLQLAVKAGYVEELDDRYKLKSNEYDKGLLQNMFDLLRSRDLMKAAARGERGVVYYWVLPQELFRAFKDVYVLTYLFKGQGLYYFFVMHDIEFQYISVGRDNERYVFCKEPRGLPPYVGKLGDMINILNDVRMNRIGSGRCALSMNWYKRGGEPVARMKSNLCNYFMNIHRGVPANKKMWGTFAPAYNKLKGGGYTKAFLNFSARATNNYDMRTHLAYPVNIFMNATEKHIYERSGLKVDEDLYALSVMIQWIWRSAIRNGQKIQLYLPSRRMRGLLTNWMENAQKAASEEKIYKT